MIRQIALGLVLLALTTVIHASFMDFALHTLRWTHAERWNLKPRFTSTILTAGLVLIMFFASMLEAVLWAGTYVVVDAISAFEPAFYFSMVTYTTLGFGDMTLDEGWRILSSIEAANGIIMFGWTTALIVYFVGQQLRSLGK